jgi:hypothetical protein
LELDHKKSLKNGRIHVDEYFYNFYMTLLANKLCEINSIALLTDNVVISNFTDKIKLNNTDIPYRFDMGSINIEQGILTNLIIESIKINPLSSLEDIIKFKENHRDELGLFRLNIEKLTKNIANKEYFAGVKQEIEDLYKDEFVPSYNNLKKSLTSSGIKWIADNFMKIACFSTGATAFLPTMLGLTIPQALIAGTGVSLVTSLISYHSDKNKKFNENPYSYLLTINNQL